ncbi:Iodothyronine deiodinase [Mariniblastus fucicola]|uniref:Iodothyronine deiodinase n=2 Tax=Mariniblastus fucicola TaxID=980251 RepID=A0A5B9PIS9_9BACT|nr:Iodothyronine deiodinase [Mariniblastus fucicola]
MQSKYADKVQFFIIYSREAHAADSDRPAGFDVEQPVSTEERREVALKFLKQMGLEIPALLDDIDDKTSQDYVSLPDRLYLVGKDGNIAYAGDKGPRGFKPDELEEAIEDELKANVKTPAAEAESLPRENGSRENERMTRMLSRIPAFAAINKDGDNQLSAAEIEAAAEALLTLDKDGDGELSREELRPTRRGR